MLDPLSSTFGEEPPPPWPTTPRTPNTPIPNMPRPSTPRTTSRPQTPDKGNSNPNLGGLYGRQPQIYGQPEPGLVSPSMTTGSNGHKFEKGEPYLRVRITGLDRNRRDVLVKFDAQTNLSNFTGTTYRNVSRSYYEFQQFYDTIIHSTPQTIIPALPLAQTSAPTDEEDDRLVKIMLQRWLTRVCEDPILITEEEVRSFIESDFGYQPTPVTRKKASSGFSLIRRSVPDEDEELQQARFELTKLETQFFEAAKGIDKLSKVRKSLGAVRAEVGNKLVNVATTEAHPPLGNAMRKLGRASHSLADLDEAQAISECVIIGDTLGYQGLNARSAKETLQQRTSVLEEYQAAAKTTISKKRNIERLKASRNIGKERVDEALEDLNEADRYEQILARRAEGISQNLHRALARHKRLVTDDVTAALIEHVRSSIMYERQHLKELESLRADVANADKKHVPVKPAAPHPSYVPPLEDFNKPPVPRPASSNASYRRPSAPPTMSASASFNAPRLSQPQAPLPPSAISPTPSTSSFQSPLPPQSPGAGPSSPISTASGPFGADGPPLGGRLMDGTKSMFVKHAPSPLSGVGPNDNAISPSSPLTPSKSGGSPFQSPVQPGSAGVLGGGGGLNTPQTSSNPHPLSHGHSVSTGSGSGSGGADPLSAGPSTPRSASSTFSVNGQGGGGGLDPFGMARPGAFMSASVRVQPTRPRLDAREAASKLANMF
ncbi:Vps5 C terminal like-domain-containing protein [Irpex rosettiformis]|uniref:Vps5 C terminal like-domain-containing protein n=1 Tax=Irpex rosettiformis TaxID=378272 RepID=A0ACB8UD48_9APHY|nr:Vps5 C terminal like-domain-containing protein [Irpex rosettiformis]